jgi:hypothetical protein
MPSIPTSFLGLFLFSTALSLIATFTVVGGLARVRPMRAAGQPPNP